MAVTKLSLTILILTLTIINLESECVEGRHLKQNRNSAPYANKAPTLSRTVTMVKFQMQASPPPLLHGVEDFRPTAPGNSPGAGHVIHN